MEIKTVTKTSDRARIEFVRGGDSLRRAYRFTTPIYLSASNAKLIKYKGVYLQLKGRPGRWGYVLDIKKPYKWPTRARQNDVQKKQAEAELKKEALAEAKKVLSKKHLKALGLVK